MSLDCKSRSFFPPDTPCKRRTIVEVTCGIRLHDACFCSRTASSSDVGDVNSRKTYGAKQMCGRIYIADGRSVVRTASDRAIDVAAGSQSRPATAAQAALAKAQSELDQSREIDLLARVVARRIKPRPPF